MKNYFRHFVLCSIALVALLFAGCSREAKVNRHVLAGEKSFAAGKYAAAEIEFFNALRLQPTNDVAIRTLGSIYFAQDQFIKALPYLNRTKQVDPAFVENRARVSRVYFALGAVKDAVTEANFVLQAEPTNEIAILVLVDSTRTPEDAKTTRQTIVNLQRKTGDRAVFHTAFGYLSMIDGDQKLAESEFKKAIALEPQSALAHYALGNFYAREKRAAESEQSLKTAADLSPVRSARRLRLIDVKMQSGDLEATKKMLAELQSQAPDYVPAWMFTARIALAEKRYTDCAAALERILMQSPQDYDALSLRAQLRLSEGKVAVAITELERLVEQFPRVPPARYQLALAYLLNKDMTKAVTALTQTAALDPNFLPGILLLADLNVRLGDAPAAIRSMTSLIDKQPRLERAQTILGSAYVASGKLDDAIAHYNRMRTAFTNNNEILFTLGMTYRLQGKDAEARKAFEDTLRALPDHLPTVEQLAELDMRAKDYSAASQRAQRLIEKFPKEPAPLFLLAKIHVAQNKSKEAEPILEKIIEMNPDAVGAYLLLAQLYVVEKKIDPALEKLKAALAKNPKDNGSLLLAAMVYQQKLDHEKARETYEQLLAINPNSIVSLNNLSIIYSEKLQQLDKAYTLARRAYDLRPNDPTILDTFGWILAQRGDYLSALSLLRDASQKAPAEAEILSHVGLTHYFLGQEDLARTALAQSLTLSATFNGRPEAEKCLSILSVDPAAVDAKAMSLLEDRVKEKPSDPIAVSRLAAAFRQKGQPDRAIAIYERGLAADPKSAIFMARLAEVLAAQKRDPAKVLELAKNARRQTPEDSSVARIAGRLALESPDLRDQQWALGLLQESARKPAPDPESLYSLALANFTQGRLPEAEQTAKEALAAGTFPGAPAAQKFLDMAALAGNPPLALQSVARIDAALKVDPSDTPALAARAAARDQAGDSAAAILAYEGVLARYPGYSPAIRRLAVLMASRPGAGQKGFDYALRARELFPNDVEVAKALALLSYERRDFVRATQLFDECVRKNAADPQLYFHLGMARFELKQPRESKAALEKALALNETAPFAAEAKRVLASIKTAESAPARQ